MKRCFHSLAFFVVFFTVSHAADQYKVGDLTGVWKADFNANSTRLITQLRSGILGLWCTGDGARVGGELDRVQTLGDYVLDERSHQVLIQTKAGEFRVHELQTGAAVSPWFKVADPEAKGVFSPDGSTVLIGGQHGSVHVFDVRSGKEKKLIQLLPHEDECESESLPQFSPTGELAFLLDTQGKLHRYETRAWKETLPALIHPASESACYLGFSVSGDGRYAATFDAPGENGPEGCVQFWDLASSSPIGDPVKAKNGVSVTFMSSSRCLITPGRGDTRVMSLPSLKTDFTLPRHDDVEASKALVTTGDQGKYLLSWGYDQSLFLTHSATGRHAGNAALPCLVSSALAGPDPDHVWAVLDNSVVIGRSYYDQYVVKYSIPALRPVATLRLQSFILRVSLSKDGSRLLILQGTTDRERVSWFDAHTLVEWQPNGTK